MPIMNARAWSDGEIAYLRWDADAPVPECLGFMITRVHETGAEAGSRRILPTWIAFTDQRNPDWLDQDSSVWPVQQYEWRDLTLRRSRDQTTIRPIDFRVYYEIRPVGLWAPGMDKVPPSPTAPYADANGKRRYEGPRHELGFLADAVTTNPIDVTHTFGPIKATYTNGILSTQNLRQQLQPFLAAGHTVESGPAATASTQGLLRALQAQIPQPGNPIRTFLTGDVLGFLTDMMDRADQPGCELHLALYELHDPELLAKLTALVAAGKASVILSTAGSLDPNPKGTPAAQKQPMLWDTENHDARTGLHAARSNSVHDRLFNNTAHIGHNKFAVLSQNGQPKTVLTGSTNWTETGLCTQSNNVILIEDDAVAQRYRDYWDHLAADQQPAGMPASVPRHPKPINGFEPNNGVQGPELRKANAEPIPATSLGDGSTVELFFSPNTQAKTKNAKSPTPVDLARVYALMEGAKDAILFLTFFPGVGGNQNIIGTAADLAQDRPDLLVLGAISDPDALPESGSDEPKTYVMSDGKTAKLPPRAIWWPDGDNSRLVMVRAAAVTEPTGDLKPELLSAGHAIIHDKIIVVDPLSDENCAVITGSHNLGYKASYQNDENLVIIRGNKALAIAYAIHVLDVYDHYVMRAKLEDQLREALIKTGEPPASSTSSGFLKLDDSWQSKWFSASSGTSPRSYFV